MDLSSLTPEQQQAILSALGQQNQQSMDPSAFGAQSQPATLPQQAPAQPLQQQEGDKMHPMDAIAQISGQQLGPAKPTGIEHTGGLQIQQGPNGQYIEEPAQHPMLRLFGVTTKTPVNNPNFFDALHEQGLDNLMPTGLARTPDGKPFIGPEMAQRILSNQKVMFGQGKELYTTLEQLTSQGMDPDVARSMLAANPKGVTSKEVSNQMGNERLKSTKMMAEAKATMAGVAKLGQALKVGGFDAAQPMAQQAGKNLMVVQKAQPLIDQIVAQGGKADVRQQAELAGNIAMLTANNSGVLTDQRMNEFLPNSIVKKYGGWKEYFTNGQVPVDFSGFLEPLQDLLNREKVANQGVMSAASQLGINIMGLSNPQGATAIAGARNASPILGSGQVSPSVTPPVTKPTKAKTVKTAADYLSKFGGN